MLEAELDRLIATQSFDIYFQPIVDVSARVIMGYEALTRAPANSALHSPLVLFDLAATVGRLIELERLIVRRIALRATELKLPGAIFMNLTADTLIAAEDRHELIARDLNSLGLAPSRVVFELTETRPVIDMEVLGATAESLRRVGIAIALDDLGEGFASLKRWVDLRPDFVKIDRHFVDGVATDPLKQQFVRSILEMAAISEAAVIAEGIEQEGDLQMLRQLGISLCQGYLFARPSPTPRVSLRADLHSSLLSPAAPDSHPEGPSAKELCAESLCRECLTATPAMSCAEVIQAFVRDEQLYSIPMLNAEGRPIGILRSAQVLKRSAERFFMELFARKSCIELMDANALVFDVSATLRTMSEAVANIDDRYMVDGFVVTRNGQYVGAGRTSDLFKAVADQQLLLARNANPLTQLPGNVTIDRHLTALLDGRREFVVAYWDLTQFKPFNDFLGYRAGDEIIRFVGSLLSEVAGAGGGFVGHVGGDDFVMILTCADWEHRLQQACNAFDEGLHRHIDTELVLSAGYMAKDRRGREVFHRLPTLCAGVLRVEPGQYQSVRQLSVALVEPKRRAKTLFDKSGYFIERRHPSGP